MCPLHKSYLLMLIVIFNIKFEGYAELDHMWVEEVKHKQTTKVNWKFSFDRLPTKDKNNNIYLFMQIHKWKFENLLCCSQDELGKVKTKESN